MGTDLAKNLDLVVSIVIILLVHKSFVRITTESNFKAASYRGNLTSKADMICSG